MNTTPPDAGDPLPSVPEAVRDWDLENDMLSHKLENLQAQYAAMVKQARENIASLRAELAEVAAKHGHMTANAMREQARAETAEAQLAEARAALKPFAAHGAFIEQNYADHDDGVIAAGVKGSLITIGDFRKAHALLARTKGGDNG